MSAKPDIWMPLYIGDYLRDTTRLTTVQHGAYFLLIMDYWTNGSLPDNDQILASITKCSDDQWQRIKPAIASKFQIEDGYWKHSRIEKELTEARQNKQKRIERSQKANLAKSLKDTNKDAYKDTVEVTPSPSPSPSESSSTKKKKKIIADKPDDVVEEVWEAFLVHRKSKRAPVTDVVIDQISSEARKAGISLDSAMRLMCARGWTGFEADWLNKSQPANAWVEQKERANAAFRVMTGQQRSMSGDVIDIEEDKNDPFRLSFGN